MLKKIFILIILGLIISTTLIKNHTKKLDEEIFETKENINYLNSMKELIQLEHDYLSSPEKLIKLNSLYFDDQLKFTSIENIKIINRLSTDTIFLKNKKLFTYSPGHPSGFLESFINVYNEIYSKYYNQKHLPIFLDLKKNLDIIKILHKIHTSSKKRKWQKI